MHASTHTFRSTGDIQQAVATPMSHAYLSTSAFSCPHALHSAFLPCTARHTSFVKVQHCHTLCVTQKQHSLQEAANMLSPICFGNLFPRLLLVLVLLFGVQPLFIGL